MKTLFFAAAITMVSPTILAAQDTAPPATDSDNAAPVDETDALAPPTTTEEQPDAPATEAVPQKVLPFSEENAEPETSKEATAALAMIDEALKDVDPETERTGNSWQLSVGESFVLVVTDPRAERMRIMMPIEKAEDVDEPTLRRVMQANFDSALDARYAIAQNLLWGTYIHPLTSLTKDDFLSGLAQTISVVANYGTSYSSGAIVFGGGDSQALQAGDLLEQLRKLNEDKARKTI